MSDIIYTGIDLSQWNGTVDFKKLKAGGYNFVILRAGYGRVASQKDTRFEEYYKKATEAGLEVGCYWFSYANTPDDGIAEANAFLSVIKGKKLSFPCYYDVEDPKTSLANGISRATLTNMVNNWCKTVEAAGYKAGVYTFYAAINRFNMAEIPYEKWLAKWSTSMGNCSPNEWGCWQYAVIGNTSECTRSGKIPGCDQCEAVDADYSFKDYPKIIGISFADPNYKPVKPEKSVEEVVKEIWEGKWDNGEERKRLLTEAGYDYNEVQREVEKLASNYSNGNDSTIIAGKKIRFNNINLYAAATSNAPSRIITGNYFIYSDEIIKGRIRITNTVEYVGKTPSGKYVTGWINVSDIK